MVCMYVCSRGRAPRATIRQGAGVRCRVRFALLVVTLAACHPPTPAMTSWPKLDDQLLADAAATFNWRLGTPTPLAITREGAVLFRRTPARDFASDLYELAPDGTPRPLAT